MDSLRSPFGLKALSDNATIFLPEGGKDAARARSTFDEQARHGGNAAAKSQDVAPRAAASTPFLTTHETEEVHGSLPPQTPHEQRHAPETAQTAQPTNKPRLLGRVVPAFPAMDRSLLNKAIGKRVAVLLALVAVPAMAAQSDFGALPGDAPTEAEIVSQRLAKQLAENPAMDFEKPGRSFPGSAFFFLADPPKDALIALPTFDASDPGAAEAGHELGELIRSGPAAQPFFSVGGMNGLRAQECLAQAVWYEAASESEAGQRAVAQVVLNRVAHSNWPSSVCGVVYQGSERRTGCQFTFTCDGSLARKTGGASWARAQRVAADALAGSVYEPVGYATHYHTLWVNPYWASSLDHVGTIGAHRFYKNRGRTGDKRAFTTRYTGVEPTVSGRMTPPPAGVDMTPDFIAPVEAALPRLPKAPTGAFSQSVSSTSGGRASVAATPDANLADPSLTGVGQVRDDYARAGQWKSDAARAALQSDERALAEESAEKAPKRQP